MISGKLDSIPQNVFVIHNMNISTSQHSKCHSDLFPLKQLRQRVELYTPLPFSKKRPVDRASQWVWSSFPIKDSYLTKQCQVSIGERMVYQTWLQSVNPRSLESGLGQQQLVASHRE